MSGKSSFNVHFSRNVIVVKFGIGILHTEMDSVSCVSTNENSLLRCITQVN